jgi:lysozyme family protein
MNYTNAYEKAVDHAMKYEVGGFWRLTPDVEVGLISTPEQRKACGYTNDPHDRGGETKYGVAKSANPDINIAALDWDGAKDIYYNRYWLKAKCDEMPPRVAVLHFDSAVNHGVGRAAKFLQASVGALADGTIGPATIQLANKQDEIVTCNTICNFREQFYKTIAERDPTQARYLNGWLRRINEMRAFVTNLSIDF